MEENISYQQYHDNSINNLIGEMDRLYIKKEGYESLEISDFDLSEMVQNSVSIFIGRRGVGKTTMIKHICQYDQSIGRTIISPRAIDEYGDQPNQQIFTRYDDNVVDNIYAEQIRKIMRMRENKKVSTKYGLPLNEQIKHIVVFDDCLQNGGTYFNNKNFANMIGMSTHLHLQVMWSMCTPFDISPHYITCFDYVFLFRDNDESKIRMIYNHYGGVFGTFDLFREAFNEVTRDEYSCMIICNRGRRRRVFRYMIPNIGREFDINLMENNTGIVMIR
jgi:hypothetical protein